jgi:50S ribosomal protein L16 3-hydroxylase
MASPSIWRGRLYVSGQDLQMPVRDAQRLAGSERIDGGLYASLSTAGRDAVHELLHLGCYQWLAEDDAG